MSVEIIMRTGAAMDQVLRLVPVSKITPMDGGRAHLVIGVPDAFTVGLDTAIGRVAVGLDGGRVAVEVPPQFGAMARMMLQSDHYERREDHSALAWDVGPTWRTLTLPSVGAVDIRLTD